MSHHLISGSGVCETGQVWYSVRVCSRRRGARSKGCCLSNLTTGEGDCLPSLSAAVYRGPRR